MIVIVDTGPLIALAKLQRIDLLDIFEAAVVIPPFVERELLSQPASETVDIEQALGTRIDVRAVPSLDAAANEAVHRLDAGERQAVSLAVGLDEDTLLIIDDKAGRRVARHLDCAVTGVIGLLLRAKERGAIAAVTPLLRTLQHEGYWLSDDLIQQAQRLAGESTESPDDS